ncbi:MAG: hypothetical protein WBP26_00340 [Candidatus Saccharimonadales bacterium]
MDEQNIQVNDRIRDFSYISDLFKHIEGFNLMGHKIGRKVGDMLELLVMAKIFEDSELASRVVYEPKLVGATGAGHKVEFGFFEPNQSSVTGEPFGFIECKKVGVEVTKNALTKNRHLVLTAGGALPFSYSRAWMTAPVSFGLEVKSISAEAVTVMTTVGELDESHQLVIGDTLKIVLTEGGKLVIVGPTTSLRDVQDIVRSCKILKLEKIEGEQSHWSVWDCLTGPQTIEKAKQASLVAMDVRKRVDGQWGRDDLPEADKSVTSILVLTEASHWEQKSRKVITLCIDHNLIVPDAIIVECFKIFEKKYGLDDMLDKIRKSEFEHSAEVRALFDPILEQYKNKLFYDLNLGTYVDFGYQNGKLVVSEAAA